MKKREARRILWGIGFLAAAVFLVLDQMNVLSFHLGFWSIFWTVIFAAGLISSLAKREIFGTVFSLAFLAIIYANPLGISRLAPWTILLVALLVSIGLSILFKRNDVFKSEVFVNGKKVDAKWKDIKTRPFHADHFMSDSDEIEEGEDIVISQKLSDTSRYIHSQNLRSVTVNSFIGDTSIYFDKAQAADDSVVLNLNAAIGDVDLYVPSDWQVINELNASFGDIDYFGHSTKTGTKLILRGNKKVGDLEIHFV